MFGNVMNLKRTGVYFFKIWLFSMYSSYLCIHCWLFKEYVTQRAHKRVLLHYKMQIHTVYMYSIISEVLSLQKLYLTSTKISI